MSTNTKNAKTTATKTARQTAADAVTEAREILARRQRDHSAAELAQEDLTDRLNSGDETVTTADMTEAATAVERADILVKAAERALAKAIKNAEVTDKVSVAGVIADAIRPVLTGVPVKVVDSTPDRSQHDGQPVVYVHQRNATKQARTGGGALSAEVIIEMHTAAPLALTEDALRKAVEECPQVSTGVVNGSEQLTAMKGGGYISTVGASIQRGWEFTPYIPTEPTAYHAKLASADAATALRATLTDWRAGGALSNWGELIKSEVVDGERRSLVRLSLSMTNASTAKPYDSASIALTAGLVELEGRYADGLGRCVGLKVEGERANSGADVRNVAVTVTALAEFVAAVA
ncbi:hypothetical protein AB0B97_29800 [Micromonospora sp. NPDC049004]|uniref:hypothetical protein n=1 Tax=Micromonospora sp. NPDC049004 TaxID=3154348 RepID=UPI0033D2E31B